MTKEYHGFLFGALSALSITATSIFVKLAAEVPNEVIIFFRFAGSLILLLLLGNRRALNFSVQKLSKHLFRAVMGLSALYCYFYAVKKLPLFTAMTLSNTTPLFIPFVVLIWLKLLIPTRRFFAVALGFIGVVLIFRPTEGLLEMATLSGLAAGLFGAVALVGLRQLSKSESTQALLFYYFLIAVAVSFFPMLYTWKPIESLEIWVYLGAISLFASAFQYFLTLAYTHAPATKASTASYLGVVFSGLADWWIWGHVPSWWVFAGTVLIIAGGVLALFDKKPPRPLTKGYTIYQK